MATITGVLLLPFLAPVWGFRFVLERLRDEAEAVLQDEGRAFAELVQLSMRHASGELSDAQYAEQEAELLERLNTIRDHRHELLRSELPSDEDEWSPLYDGPSANEQDEYESMFAEFDEGEEVQ